MDVSLGGNKLTLHLGVCAQEGVSSVGAEQRVYSRVMEPCMDPEINGSAQIQFLGKLILLRKKSSKFFFVPSFPFSDFVACVIWTPTCRTNKMGFNHYVEKLHGLQLESYTLIEKNCILNKIYFYISLPHSSRAGCD